MTGRIGRSPSPPPPMAPTSTAAATPKTLPQTQTATTRNPHQSDASTAKPDRMDIQNQAQQFPSPYGSAVGKVNSFLANPLGGKPFGISPASKQSVMQNLQGVSQGSMTIGQAHANEAATFGKDAAQSFKTGNYGAAAMEMTGATFNSLGAIAANGAQGLGSGKPVPDGGHGNF